MQDPADQVFCPEDPRHGQSHRFMFDQGAAHIGGTAAGKLRPTDTHRPENVSVAATDPRTDRQLKTCKEY